MTWLIGAMIVLSILGSGVGFLRREYVYTVGHGLSVWAMSLALCLKVLLTPVETGIAAILLTALTFLYGNGLAGFGFLRESRILENRKSFHRLLKENRTTLSVCRILLLLGLGLLSALMLLPMGFLLWVEATDLWQWVGLCLCAAGVLLNRLKLTPSLAVKPEGARNKPLYRHPGCILFWLGILFAGLGCGMPLPLWILSALAVAVGLVLFATAPLTGPETEKQN